MTSTTTKKNISKKSKKISKVAVDAEVALDAVDAEVALDKVEEVAVGTCQHIIMTGKNKNNQCGKKVVNNTFMCSKHTKIEPESLTDSVIDYVKALLESGKSVKEVSKLLDSKKVKKEIQSIICPAKTKKTKKKKDPAKPKGTLNSYMFFCAANRDRVKDENPDLKTIEISSKLGQEWKKLSDKKKKHFQDLAKADTDRYNEELKNYTSSEEFSNSDKESKKKEKSVKKRTSNACELWKFDNKEEIKADNPDMTGREQQAEINRIWNGLSDEEKQPWKDAADKLKADKKNESSSDSASSESESVEKTKVPKKKKSKVEDYKSESSESESELEKKVKKVKKVQKKDKVDATNEMQKLFEKEKLVFTPSIMELYYNSEVQTVKATQYDKMMMFINAYKNIDDETDYL